MEPKLHLSRQPLRFPLTPDAVGRSRSSRTQLISTSSFLFYVDDLDLGGRVSCGRGLVVGCVGGSPSVPVLWYFGLLPFRAISNDVGPVKNFL